MCYCCIITWAVIITLILMFTLLSFFSNLLRDDIDNPAAFMANASFIPKFKSKKFVDISRPFSLSRVQLAVWTTIIGSSYIYLSLCHGYVLDLASSKTALALLGISAGTSGFANLVDTNQGNQPNNVPRHQNGPSSGNFLIDILSDQNGISVHRFQNVVWTIIAIVLYLCKLNPAINHLPDLDGTLIAMTGISNAAYLTLKINENKNS